MRILGMLFLVCLLSSTQVQLSGQYFENPEKKAGSANRFFFGGGLGLEFGQISRIEVAPIVGYKVTEKFQPGIGLTYSYYNDKRFNVPMEYSTYGGSVFARYFLFEGFFAHAEFEALNLKVYTLINGYIYDTRRKWIDSYLVGGGYYQKLGERSGIYILILYNLNETEFTPYTNPVMRIGFNF